MTKRFDPTTRNLVDMGPAEWHGVPGPARVRPRPGHRHRFQPLDRHRRRRPGASTSRTPSRGSISSSSRPAATSGSTSGCTSTAPCCTTATGCRCVTSLVLLRKAADGPELDGYLEQRHPDGEIYDWFRYDVVRVWEQPVEQVLAAGLTVLPLAPVSRVERAKVPEVLVAISERLERETTPDQAKTLWNATTILMGLRYSKDEIDGIIRGVSKMLFGIRGIEESSVYQDILQKGDRPRGEEDPDPPRYQEVRATRRAGQAQIAALDDLDRLHELGRWRLDVATWDELLGSLNQ